MLELKELYLKNFGKIKEQTIAYKNGFNLILAKNGTGKSTQLQSILMHLIDEYEGKYEDYINNTSDYFETYLVFSLNEITYKSFISCSKEKKVIKSSREIINMDTGKVLTSTPSDSKELLLNLFDPLLIKYGLIVRQGTKKEDLENSIVACKDVERRELFKKLKDIDYKKIIESEIDPAIRLLEEKITELDKKIYSLEQQDYTLKSEMPLSFTKQEIEDKKNSLQKYQLQKENIKLHNEKVEEQKKEQEQCKETIKKLSEKVNLKNQTLNNIKTQINYYEGEEYLKDIQNKKELIIKYNSELENQKQNTKNQIDILEKDLLTFTKIKQDKIIELQNKDQTLSLSRIGTFDDSTLSQLLIEQTTIENNIKRIKEDKHLIESGTCPTCGQSCDHLISDKDVEIQTKEKDLDNIKEKLEQAKLLKKEYEEKVKRNDETKAEKQQINIDITSLQTEINNKKNSIENEINQYENNFKLLQKETENKNQLIEADLKNSKETADTIIQSAKEQEISILKDIAESEEEKIKITIKLTEIEKWLQNNSYQSDSLETLQNIENLESEIEQYNTILISNENVKKHNKEVQLKKDTEEKSLKEFQNTKQELLNEKLCNEESKNILLKDFPNFIIDNTVSFIEENMNTFIEQVYDRKLNVKLVPTKSSIALKYGSNENNLLPAHRLSGAESRLVQLSFVFDFNKYLGCVILDEPDSAMDEDNKKTLYSSLLEMQDIYKQIIIVTHSNTMKNFLLSNCSPNVIYL